MKHLNVFAGFVLACCLFLFIGANPHQTSSEGIPRYHVSFANTPMVYVYDAVTGKYKAIPHRKVPENGNLKDLLEQE
jgi:hypothetical protein